MKYLGLFKRTQVFKITLAIAIVFIVYIASNFYFKMHKLDESVELIATSNKTQLELEKLLSIISDSETSIRSYIITKNENYLTGRFGNRGEIELNLKRLKKLTEHSPEISKDLDTLKGMFDHRFNLFWETLLIAKSKNVDSNVLNAKMLETTDYSNRMRAMVYNRINTEAGKVRHLNDTHQFELENSIISAFLLVIISLLVLMLSYNKMNIDYNALKTSNDELQFLNHSFNNAEKIAGFGHWKVNLETGTYTFSANYYKLLGISPNKNENPVDSITNSIHPDDVDFVVQTHKKSLTTLEPTSIVCRFVLPNQELKYMMVVGSFTKNSKGQHVKIGVNYDVTELYTKTVELEQNNRELNAINEELESFNNIVSHDLQEPLRKIQMFISRLEENEEDLLSDQGKDYFSKIRTAANRMQRLMIDLVNYTRTIKGDKVFVKTNLLKLLEQIVQDLAVNIEEKNATVTIGKLPIIMAIPFQIEQLFINLITNSLKYSKENIAPIITIAAVKIEGTEVDGTIEMSDKNYYKLLVSDNGIGFKQEYAERIFMLFQRLETDSKYSGTGLGLAICKKIIENHSGLIRVKSSPNIGTEFSIYLPKII